ncbi:MAG: hypothetical protein JST00_43495 [Deltaproteobacteria bacterium]|nr:hypothetical protein [Deltaproteobacteria bacterium]
MSKRIVLVDPAGDVLFSGASLAAEEPRAATPSDDAFMEACPETLRSPTNESGVFPFVKAARARDEQAA